MTSAGQLISGPTELQAPAISRIYDRFNNKNKNYQLKIILTVFSFLKIYKTYNGFKNLNFN
jgi:hypothetical protein